MTDCEICILAGGLSARMGRDKALVKLGGKSMLGHVRAVARRTGLKVRVIRRDLVPRCGPLGGIYTALKTTKATQVVFLACDMPCITVGLLRRVLKRRGQGSGLGPLFTVCGRVSGFPFMLPRTAVVAVERQITKRSFSIHALASALKADRLRLPNSGRRQLRNINSAEDLEDLKKNLSSCKTRETTAP